MARRRVGWLSDDTLSSRLPALRWWLVAAAGAIAGGLAGVVAAVVVTASRRG